MSVLRQSFLESYDQCKRIRSPEQCREIVARGASVSVDGYLKGYDLCVQTFGQERCRLMLSSPKTATVTIAVVALVAGFLVGRVLR